MEGVDASTELLLKTLQISGATTAGASAFILQFGQALGTGRATGEELNTILEQNVFFGKLLAEQFGVSVGELKKLASEGKITSKVLIETLLKDPKRIRDTYAKLPITFSQAWQVYSNGLSSFLGKVADIVIKSSGIIDDLIKAGEYLLDLSTKSDQDIVSAIFGSSFELQTLKDTVFVISKALKLILQTVHIIIKSIALVIGLVRVVFYSIMAGWELLGAGLGFLVTGILKVIEQVINLPRYLVLALMSSFTLIKSFIGSSFDALFKKVETTFLKIQLIWLKSKYQASGVINKIFSYLGVDVAGERSALGERINKLQRKVDANEGTSSYDSFLETWG